MEPNGEHHAADPAAGPAEHAPAGPADHAPAGPAEHAPTLPRRPNRGRELLIGVGTLLLVAALGFPIGWLWQQFTPRAELVAAADGLYYTQAEPEQVFAGDGAFIVIGLAVGVVLSVLSWTLLRRYRGPVQLVALVLGSIAGAIIAAWFGHRFGLTEFRHFVDAAEPGTRASAPVGLRAAGKITDGVPGVQGSVLAQAIAVVLLYSMLAGLSSEPSLQRRPVRSGEPDPFHTTGPSTSDESWARPLSSGSAEPPDRPGTPEPPGSAPAAPPPG